MGVMKRGTKTKVSQVKAFPIPDRKGPTMSAVVRDHVSDFATIYTDEFASYRPLKFTHDHEIVIHSRGEYVRGDVHTNTIEGFWSLFERQVIGQHHFVSIKHLQRYLDERTWSYNNRGEEDLFWLVMVRLAIKAAMPYAKLTEGPSASPRTIRRS